MEVENITLSEVSQIQKDKFTYKQILTIEHMITKLQFVDPERLGKEEWSRGNAGVSLGGEIE